jgi:hypothetical protein
MISDFIAAMFAWFVIDPLQAELQQQIERANAPVQIVQQSQKCLATEGPRLLERAGTEPGWAVTTAFSVAIGWTSPEQVFDPANPNCNALRDLIDGQDRTETEV